MSHNLATRFSLSIPRTVSTSSTPVQPQVQPHPQLPYSRSYNNPMANSWKGVPCRQFNSSVKKGCGCGGG